MTLPPGTRLGPYEVLSPLGTGGMGEVYFAKDSRLEREVALKILPPEVGSDPDRHRRFEEEARAASALNHPNIITVYDIGASGATSFIAMELVRGKTLRELINDGPLPVRRLIALGSQIAEGLSTAHEAGVVHRDLKPENVMVTREGLVKILDFGLAKRTPARAANASSVGTEVQGTEPGTVMGTAGYMSPEQAIGQPLDFRSDQFSLGAVLYEMATGRRAFGRRSVPETLTAILREEPEPLAAAAPATPAPLCWIIERCLAKDPEERYASSRDLARDISTVRERFSGAEPQPEDPRPARLPRERTAFIGRERERASIKERLQRPDAFLVTLTGPGGIGKTRLGLEVARELEQAFPGGAYFVPLAPLSDPDLIPSTICQVFGLKEGRNRPPLALLRDYLQTHDRAPMLLVLDGFEHLGAAAPLVADIAAAGAALKILVTSRSPLHVSGELEVPVPPLAMPDPRESTFEALSRCDAVALFLNRAGTVKPNFAVTEENVAAIADICARLDGLPLAIELAAARVKLLSPSAIRARLASRLQLLIGGARDLPVRQQTLRGTIDWSYDLMSASEQKLLRRLSVFAGGCTLEAVEAVCNATSDLELDALDGMSSIVDKSLVQQLETPEGEPRFSMLETIREYASERLAAGDDEALTRRAHAAYFMVLAEEEGGEDAASEQETRLDRFELEHDNFRSALDWAAEGGEAEWGLRIGAALFTFWETRDHLAEGRQRLERLLALPASVAPTRARARALFAAGILVAEQGDYDTARTLLADSIAIHRRLDDTWGVAVSLNALAVHALDQGDLATSQSLFEENVTLWRGLGGRAAIARALSNLANVAKMRGDQSRARALYDECLEIFRELGDRAGAAWTLDHQGDVAREQGDDAAARRLYEESLAIFRELGDRWGVAGVLSDLGNLACSRRDYAEAHALYRQSLTIFQELRHKRGIARTLECFACSAVAEQRPERALHLAGAAAALRRRIGAPLPSADQAKIDGAIDRARKALPDAIGTTSWMEGWALSLDEAVSSALTTNPPSSAPAIESRSLAGGVTPRSTDR
jgi:predicted ATPase